MSKNAIYPADLSAVLTDELTLYNEQVLSKVNKASKKAVDELVRITKDTAPYDVKHHGRHFVDCIAASTDKRRFGNTYIWHVKAPCYRLTHLLVHGHAARDGSRVRGDPFLHNAWDRVRPQYEHDVEEAVRGDK